jgi:dihydropteroate synthase
MIARRKFVLQARERTLSLGPTTAIMGIINVTPDSFSGDGQGSMRSDSSKAVALGKLMLRDGALIIDVGGESTRPGASEVSAEEEIRRIVPVIKKLAVYPGVMISADTSKVKVAAAALEAGAHIINVVQGTPVDCEILNLVKKYKAGIILMHSRGNPRTMQSLTVYKSLVPEIIRALKESLLQCRKWGIKKNSIIVDPGFGFAKTEQQNFQLLARLDALAVLSVPVLVGPSRKSFIGNRLGIKDPAQRLIGTVAAVTASILQGAHIVRVHDVAAIRQATVILDTILAGGK